jgi:hypothetical protein
VCPADYRHSRETVGSTGENETGTHAGRSFRVTDGKSVTQPHRHVATLFQSCGNVADELIGSGVSR